ncbi:DsrE/DsrF/DrsH-like family protein [Nitratifractor sp.]|uniref:DsrE family protein n=1 Tax=Nitratifractor sp. TaxID=2268144 RepID=UPI0025FB232F|nr:DsrE/DsrF/DrsH-like family protein [Nitratifractor sp.]
MKRLLLFLVLLLPLSLFAKMEFSDPKPSFDHPRKWVVPVKTDDIHVINHIIGGINNVLNEYPPESLQVAMVFYSSGMRVIRKDYDAKTLTRIKSLMDGYDVEMIGCINTMKTMGWKKKDYIEGIVYRQAGIAEVLERAVAGWIVFAPY